MSCMLLRSSYLKTYSMTYAAKAKTQQFIRRKSNLMKKTDQLTRLCYASCSDHSQEWKILYLSIDRSRTMIFYHNRNRTYEFDTSILNWLESRKHRTRCLSIFYSQTLISLFVKSRTSQRRMSRRIRSLIRLRRSSQRHRRICEIWWHIAKRNRQRSILNENLSDGVMIRLCEEDIEEHVS